MSAITDLLVLAMHCRTRVFISRVWILHVWNRIGVDLKWNLVVHHLPWNKKFGHFSTKPLSLRLADNVSYAVQGKVDVDERPLWYRTWLDLKWNLVVHHLPWNKKFGHFSTKPLSLRLADNVSYAVQGKVDVDERPLWYRTWLDLKWNLVVHHLPWNKKFGYFSTKSLSHRLAANVSYAVQGKVDMDGVTAHQICLDVLDDQLDQVTVFIHQHWDE